MDFAIRDVQICGRSRYVFTDNEHPRFAVLTEGGAADSIDICVSHNGITDWLARSLKGPYIDYQGLPLIPKTKYEIRIRATRGKTVSEACVTFDTGFLKENWKASWIEPVQDTSVLERKIRFYETFKPELKKEFHPENLRPAQLVRKCFNLDQIPDEALVYATAHGVYELKINGIKADSRMLPPEISTYPKRLYYQRYDILPFLKEGENEVEFTIADGWWCGRIGLIGASCQYGDRLGLLCQIELRDGDSTTIIGSDDSFECTKSDFVFADLYIGEKRDLTCENGSWQHVLKADYPMNNLYAQELEPVTEVGQIPGKIFVSPKGDVIIDFGQTLSGVVDLHVNATGKREIRIEHCEALDSNGEFFQNIVGRNKQQTDIYFCESWPAELKPHFTYHGFRYARVTGVSAEEIESAEAIVLGTPIEFTSDFKCSDEKLNQLQHNIIWSMKSNFFSIPTDCPQREKMGWTGDIQTFVSTALLNADVRGFLENWLVDMRHEQRPNGEVPNYIPDFPINDEVQREGRGENTSAAWGDACIILPEAIYNSTGDKNVLRDNLDMMRKWLGYIASKTAIMPEDFDSFDEEKKKRYQYLWNEGAAFGDWLIPSFLNEPDGINKGILATKDIISSAFYAVSLRAYLYILSILNDDSLKAEEEATQVLLENVKNAVKDEYVSENGYVSGDLQGLYVIILYADIVEGELKKKVAKRLVQKIIENDYHLDTGFVTTPYILQVLYDNGYENEAFRLLLQDTPPSWLYQVKMGATTIWENWTAILPDGTVTESSMNHYALGSVGSFVFRYIGGIRKVDLVNNNVMFEVDVNAPVNSSLCEIKILYGTVRIEWKKCGGKIDVKALCPIPFTVKVGDTLLECLPGEIAKTF